MWFSLKNISFISWKRTRVKSSLGQLGTLPDLAQLTKNYQYCGYKYLEIDEKNNTVYLSHPLAQIDVGGLAKGYATEKVAQILKDHGLKHGVLNAGGNVKFMDLNQINNQNGFRHCWS